MFNTFIELGKLDEKQKEQTWKQTISASQAWMLYKEPYNLIRDKLGKERIFPSAYDNIPEKVSNSLKANGKFYEQPIMKDIAQNFLGDKKYEYADITYASVINKDITATPDFVTFDSNGSIDSVNDIKASSSSIKELQERYIYQILHQCAVIGVNDGYLWVKGAVSKPIQKIAFSFTDDEINAHLDYCVKFLLNLKFGLESAYDDLANVKVEKEPIKAIDLNAKANKETKELATKFWELNSQKKEIESQLDELKETFKSNFTKSSNLYLNGNDYVSIVWNVLKPKTNWEQLARDLMEKHNESESLITQYTGTETKDSCTITAKTAKKAKVFKS